MDEHTNEWGLVGHNILFHPEDDFAPLPPIQNIIVEAGKPEDKWLELTMSSIGDWRAQLRSTYIRWALAINGLDVAANKYSEPNWASKHKFIVSSLRNYNNMSGPVPIAEWDGLTASDAHRKTMPMLAAFGLIHLYANLDEVVFAMFRIFLNQNPRHLLQGDEFRDLRILYKESGNDELKKKEWDDRWRQRLNDWQRKRLYDGLGKVFKSYCDTAGLKTPKIFKNTTIDNWAESIEMIGMIRNAVVHGVKMVSPELGDACKEPYSMTFNFKEGDPLNVQLIHLQGVELFCDQWLNGLNFSLLDRMGVPPPLP